MKLNLPADTTVRGVTFGTPRVGNQAWANFFDSHISDFTRMNNMYDPVPVVPGRDHFHYRHPKGEIHLQADGSAVICPSPDDGDDPQCSDLMVQDVLTDGNTSDHNGPYGPYRDILIGTQHCTP